MVGNLIISGQNSLNIFTPFFPSPGKVVTYLIDIPVLRIVMMMMMILIFVFLDLPKGIKTC